MFMFRYSGRYCYAMDISSILYFEIEGSHPSASLEEHTQRFCMQYGGISIYIPLKYRLFSFSVFTLQPLSLS